MDTTSLHFVAPYTLPPHRSTLPRPKFRVAGALPGNASPGSVVGVDVQRRILVVVAAAALCVGAHAPRAHAHPSDLETLTIDLLLDRGGLVLIDAAANHASYQEAPSPEQRVTLAFAVLDALGVPRDSVEVDSENSLLYHEVGFSAWLHQPFANTTVPGELRVDTRTLQSLARDSVGSLRLDVCRVSWPDQQLVIDTEVPPSATASAAATTSPSDRRDCSSWRFQPGDAPATLTARVVPLGPDGVAPRSTQLVCGPAADLDRDAVVTGAIALSRTRLHARATGAGERSSRLVADTFLFVKIGSSVELVVPRAWRGRLSLGARNGARATSRGAVYCAGSPGSDAWSVVPVSLGVDRPSCVPIIVRTAKTARRVHLGIGVPCSSRSGGG
jgi:hypothetical protein